MWDGEKHPSLKFTPSFFTPLLPLPWVVQGDGRGSWDQSVTAALCHCSSHTFPLLQRGLLFMVFSFLQGTCFNKRSSIAAGGYLLHIDLHGLQGDWLLHHGLLQGLQDKFFSSFWSTSSPSFFNDLGVCRVVAVTDSHSSLSQLQFFVAFLFFSSLNTFSPEVSPPQLCPVMGGLEPGGTICVLHGTAPASPHRDSLQPPLRLAPGHLHPVHLSTLTFPK